MDCTLMSRPMATTVGFSSVAAVARTPDSRTTALASRTSSGRSAESARTGSVTVR